MKRLSRLCAGFAALAFAATAAPAQERGCVVHDDLARLDYPLYRTARDLEAGKKVTIVAIGSSSTAGAGATSADKSYPAQLEQKLRARFPGSDVRVINRGQNGDTIMDMQARLEASVLRENPQLVLLQAGTNSVLRDQPMDDAGGMIGLVIYTLRLRGIDVMLVDQQFAPKVNEKPHSATMLDILQTLSSEYGVPVFQRHALMKRWHDKDGLGFEHFIHPDRLHMNDWSYHCVAENMAQALSRAVTPPSLALRR